MKKEYILDVVKNKDTLILGNEKIKKFNDLKNSKKVLPFLLKDENNGIDIDTKEDWERFKKIFNLNKLNK